MPYIGKTELKSSDVVADSFTGNGSTTAFTLSKAPPSDQAVLVSINGVKQHTDAYSISGTTLTLSAAPDSGDAIEAVSIIDIGEAAGDSLPTQTGNSGKFLTTDGSESSWSDLSLGDNDNIKLGADDDLQIYHDGSNSYLSELGQGDLVLQSNGAKIGLASSSPFEWMVEANTDGAVNLFHNGSKKLATTSTGIDVTGSVRADSFSGGSTTRSITISESNGNDSAIIYASSGDKLELRANSNTYNQVVLAEDGNVGISETSADRKLHVNSGTTNVVAKFESTDSHAVAEFTDSAGSAEIGCVGNDVAFFPAGVEKMRIDSSGNVGIGQSSPNLASGWNKVLHVHSAGSGSMVRFTDITTGTADNGLMIGQYGNESYLINRNNGAMRFYTNNTERLRITSSGDVDIVSASQVRLSLGSTGTAGTNSCNWVRGTGNLMGFNSAGGGFHWEIGGTEKMKIASTGWLISAPTYSNTTANSANLYMGATGTFERSTSSIKYKKDVETIEDSYADSILNLRPVWFKSKCANDNPDWGHWGLIAEEVAEIDPRLVFWRTDEYVDQTNEETGETEQVTIPLETPEAEGVQYDRMIPHLINLLQRQDARIQALEAQLNA